MFVQKKAERVYSHWMTLVRGLLIRERLKKRFDLQDRAPSAAATVAGVKRRRGDLEKGGAPEEDGGQAVGNMDLCWPQNIKTKRCSEGGATSRDRRGEEKNLFPFEKKSGGDV